MEKFIRRSIASLTLGLLGAVTVFPSSLAAQEVQDRTTTVPGSPGAYRFVPADASFVLRTSGLSGFAGRLGQTNAYGLFQSEPVRQKFTEFGALLLRNLRRMDAPPEAIEWMLGLADSLSRYSGQMVIGGRFGDGLVTALTNEDASRLLDTGQVFLSMTPAEGFDAAALVAQVLAPAEEEGMPPTERLEVGPGFDMVRLPFGEDLGVVLPTAVDGGVVMAVGAGLEGALASMFDGQSFPSDRIGSKDEASAMSFYFDLSEVMETVRTISRRRFEDVPEDAIDDSDLEDVRLGLGIAERLGLGALGSMSGTVAAAGEFLDLQIDLRFGEAAQPIFDLLRLSGDRSFEMADLIASEEGSGALGFLDVRSAAELAFGMMAEFGAPMGRPEVEQQLQEALGVDLESDILDQLTGEVAYVQTISPEAFQGTDVAMEVFPFGMTFGLGLADPPRFEAMISRLLREFGLHPQVARNEYRGKTVYTISLGFLELDYAFLPQGAVLSVGNGEEPVVRRWIDRSQGLLDGSLEAAWPEPIARRLSVAGRDFDGLQFSQLGGLGPVFQEILSLAKEEVQLDPTTEGPEREAIVSFFGLLETLVGEMEGAELDVSVQTVEVRNGLLRMRLIQ